MNLPNKITLVRIFIIPIMIFFIYAQFIPFNYTIALGLFVVASITDWLDGYIARKQNLVTDFGKFLDPLADKVLVVGTLLCFLEMGLVGAIPVIIIIFREFMVSGLRLVVANKGVVVAAGIWGKLKTAFTMIVLIAMYLFVVLSNELSGLFSQNVLDMSKMVIDVFVWIATGLTVISGAVYLNCYWKYIMDDK